MSFQMLKINNLMEGTVIKRPSAYIKTPYVADIIPINGDSSILGHTASLGCCGLVDIGATILMAPVPKSKKNDNKDIYIYYKNEIILEICKNTNFCFILNCLSNIYKNMENNILIQLMTNKFDRNVLLNHKYIYYKQDKIVSFLKANLNFISYYLKFIG